MTDLERRALLGDRKAQEECTRQGIVLPCPMCGKYLRERKTIDWLAKRTEPVNRTIVEHPCKTGCHLDNWVFVKEKELDSWNTRPAHPVGRCGECEHLKDNDGVCLYCEVFNMTTPGPEAFCCRFEPKGGE